MGNEIAMTIRPSKARGGHGTVQGGSLGRSWTMVAILGLAGGLAGCSSVPKPLNPVSWWHGLQGGAIAEQRPTPPGANDPYPNLASVPDRPTPTDPKLRQQIADALIADRSNARHEAGAAQPADPSNPSASPSLFGRGSVPPPGPAAPATPPPDARPAAVRDGMAASAPAPTRTQAAVPDGPPRVSPAPRGTVAAAPLEPPATTPSAPAVPAAPPAPANLPGAVASAPVPATNPVAAAVPAPAVATPAPSANAAVAATRPSVGVPFALGSATVPRASLVALRQLATRRGAANIAVTGYGEAAANDPAAQQAGISLALARAQAVASVLTSAGVPATAIRVDAEAAGRGAAARLVD